MAGTSLFALIDDIATMMRDVVHFIQLRAKGRH